MCHFILTCGTVTLGEHQHGPGAVRPNEIAIEGYGANTLTIKYDSNGNFDRAELRAEAQR